MANFSKPSVPRFSVDVYQNEYLPEGGREVGHGNGVVGHVGDSVPKRGFLGLCPAPLELRFLKSRQCAADLN